jgi:hypothetical protein
MRLIDAAGHAHGERRRPLLPERVAEAMLTSCAVIHPTSVMRTSAVRAVGGYRTAMPFAQDYDLWLRLMEFGKLANISDIVLLKRIHKGATTQCRKQRTAQVLSRSAAYLSYLARTMSVKDFVLTDQPLLTSTLQFIADLLSGDGPIPSAAYYNISRILRHAEFSVPGLNSSNQLYSLYFNRLLQRGSGFEVVRALWYAALYFGVNRWRGDQLAALQAFQERLIVDDAESPATSSNCTRTFLV